MTFKTISNYSGSARVFLKNYVLPNLPTAYALIDAHQNLEDYLRENSDYIVRMTVDHNLRGQWASGLGGGYKFIVSDNEPAVWSYMLTRSGEIPNFKKHIQGQTFPIAFAMKKDERAKADWKKCGRSHRDFSVVGLKHCHIAPCSPRGKPLRTQEDFKLRMLALLSPMNHFLFPGPRRHRMSKDWGEDKAFIEMLCYLVANEHYSGDQSAAFNKFLGSQGIRLLVREPSDFDIKYEMKIPPDETIVPDGFDKYEAEKSHDLRTYIDSSDSFCAIEKNSAATAHSYEQFIKILRNWLEETDQETISNECDTYGNGPWLFCKVESEILRLNRDTKREGVKEFLESDITLERLHVIRNEDGGFNLVVPKSVDRKIKFFHLYLNTGYREAAGPLIRNGRQRTIVRPKKS